MNHLVRVACCLSLALVVAGGCSKKKEDAPPAAAASDTTAAKPTTAAPATPPPADIPPAAAADKPAGPVVTTAKAVFAEFSDSNKTDPMTLLDKYHDGATITGVIKTAGASLVMDVDGSKHRILMGFTDPTSVKTVKVGDTIKATCKIGGEVDDLMQVTDCVVAK